ncbi:uncharacterized protein [Palaemon carinicauda]|uniref:uncharacterized protein isoform X2 n=1 Tax=Palaemon carinicauda TaxID=392227 RepID=UPI0035B68ADA
MAFVNSAAPTPIKYIPIVETDESGDMFVKEEEAVFIKEETTESMDEEPSKEEGSSCGNRDDVKLEDDSIYMILNNEDKILKEEINFINNCEQLNEPRPRKRRRKSSNIILPEETEQNLGEWLEFEVPFIYDKGDYRHKKKEYIERVWEEKAASLEDPVTAQDLKTWFASLRSRFGRLSKEECCDVSRRLTEREKWVINTFRFLKPHIVRQRNPRPICILKPAADSPKPERAPAPAFAFAPATALDHDPDPDPAPGLGSAPVPVPDPFSAPILTPDPDVDDLSAGSQDNLSISKPEWRGNNWKRPGGSVPAVRVQGTQEQALLEEGENLNEVAFDNSAAPTPIKLYQSRPAALRSTTNPDWAPSVKLGHDKNTTSLCAADRHQRKRLRTERIDEGIPIENMAHDFKSEAVFIKEEEIFIKEEELCIKEEPTESMETGSACDEGNGVKFGDEDRIIKDEIDFNNDESQHLNVLKMPKQIPPKKKVENFLESESDASDVEMCVDKFVYQKCGDMPEEEYEAGSRGSYFSLSPRSFYSVSSDTSPETVSPSGLTSGCRWKRRMRFSSKRSKRNLPDNNEEDVKDPLLATPVPVSPLTPSDKDIYRTKDGNVWHQDPNPRLTKVTSPHTVPPGSLTQRANELRNPHELFELFIPDEELAATTVYTNDKILAHRAKYKVQSSTTVDTSISEIKALIGILIMTGLKNDNRVSVAQMFSPFEGCSLYRSTMSKARFSFLMRVLRFDNSQTRTQRMLVDKLAPIRAMWESFVGACKNVYVPGPHLTIDEQLVPFRGKTPFKMCIPNNPAKYGMKIVMMCDSDTHFLCNAIPYLGKGTVDLSTCKTHGEYYIMELTAPYPHHGRVVTTDNWFSSLQAAQSLKKKGLDFVGAIKDKPYLPKSVSKMEIRVGESVAMYHYEKNVTLISHQASRIKRVHLVSSIHHTPSMIDKVKTDLQIFYNTTKGGVDAFDQLCANTSCIRSTRRWPLCFFFNMINMICTNSYILHLVQAAGGKALTRHEFGLQLVDHLTRGWAVSRLQAKTLPRELRYTIGSVFNVDPEIVADTDSGMDTVAGQKKRNRCHICPRSSNKKSRVFCVQCKKYTCPEHYIITCMKCIHN